MATVVAKSVFSTAFITYAARTISQIAIVISEVVGSVVEVTVLSLTVLEILKGLSFHEDFGFTNKEVEEALKIGLNDRVRDFIGCEGLTYLSKAISAIPSEEVDEMLARAATHEIDPHLWVFSDPDFLRLTRMIRAIRAIEKREEPVDNGDDDSDEEKCRYFERTDVADNSEDFIFFTVYGSSECEDGDEVFSMSAQWKKLKGLVDDPIGGHFVSQLFQELFDSSVDDGDDEESNYPVFARRLLTAKKNNFKKVVKVAYGKLVPFGNQFVYNIHGSSKDRRKSNWLKAFSELGYEKCDKCYIESENPVCGHSTPQRGNLVGGHVWSPELNVEDRSLYFYILPICKRHNKRFVYDRPRSDGTGWLKTAPDAYAMKITSTKNVIGWKEMCDHLTSYKSHFLNKRDFREHQGYIQPKNLTDWLQQKTEDISSEFAKGPKEIVFKEVLDKAVVRLKETLESVRKETVTWTKNEGHDIIRKTLIPLYAPKALYRLWTLKNDAKDVFRTKMQSALSSYKDECFKDVEQRRRYRRLVEETEKVIASEKWKDSVTALERTIAPNLQTLIDP